MSKPTDELLAEKGKQHGDFTDHARCSQRLKAVLYDECAKANKNITIDGMSFGGLSMHVMNEALDMILHKIGRIVAGDPSVQDHWDDIAGYARLVSQRLESEPKSLGDLVRKFSHEKA